MRYIPLLILLAALALPGLPPDIGCHHLHGHGFHHHQVVCIGA